MVRVEKLKQSTLLEIETRPQRMKFAVMGFSKNLNEKRNKDVRREETKMTRKMAVIDQDGVETVEGRCACASSEC